VSCLVLRGGRFNNSTLSLYYDLFFSSVGLLCGGILIFQGWRLDPILLLCQILSSGTAIFFIGESIWLRSVNSKDSTVWHNSKKTIKKKYKMLNTSTHVKTNLSKSTKEYLYEEIKLCLPYRTNSSWQTINYTYPIDYLNKF
jgi:hypothetical protein